MQKQKEMHKNRYETPYWWWNDTVMSIFLLRFALFFYIDIIVLVISSEQVTIYFYTYQRWHSEYLNRQSGYGYTPLMVIINEVLLQLLKVLKRKYQSWYQWDNPSEGGAVSMLAAFTLVNSSAKSLLNSVSMSMLQKISSWTILRAPAREGQKGTT